MSISAITSGISAVGSGFFSLVPRRSSMITLLAVGILSSIPTVKSGFTAYAACVAVCMTTYMAAVGIQTYGAGYDLMATACHNTCAALLLTPTP